MGFLTKAAVGGLLLSVGCLFVLKFPETYSYVGFETCPIPRGKVESVKSTLVDGVRKVSPVQLTVTTGEGEDELEETIIGDLYKPRMDKEVNPFVDDKGRTGAVVIAHGMASTREMGLYKFAELFANAGLVVLTFDFRRFGESSGAPRHKLTPDMLVSDYLSALDYVRSRVDVDPKRICLWGTSYSGGHVLAATARENAKVACVISQAPYLGPTPDESKLEELSKRGYGKSLQLLMGAISGVVRPWFGMDDLYMTLYGHASDSKLALSRWDQIGETEATWLSKHPVKRPNDWRNCFHLGGLFGMLRYRPLESVPLISADTAILFVSAKHDTLCPASRIDYANRIAANSELITLDSAHFTVYSGKPFEVASAKQLSFLKKHLTPS